MSFLELCKIRKSYRFKTLKHCVDQLHEIFKKNRGMMKFVYLLVGAFLIVVTDVTGKSENEPCNGEDFSITQECHACGDDELKLYQEACKETGYVEILKCKSGNFAKSCSGQTIKELHAFWRFEAAMIVTGVLAGIVVIVRMRKLDRDNTERIQRQISAL